MFTTIKKLFNKKNNKTESEFDVENILFDLDDFHIEGFVSNPDSFNAGTNSDVDSNDDYEIEDSFSDSTDSDNISITCLVEYNVDNEINNIDDADDSYDKSSDRYLVMRAFEILTGSPLERSHKSDIVETTKDKSNKNSQDKYDANEKWQNSSKYTTSSNYDSYDKSCDRYLVMRAFEILTNSSLERMHKSDIVESTRYDSNLEKNKSEKLFNNVMDVNTGDTTNNFIKSRFKKVKSKLKSKLKRFSQKFGRLFKHKHVSAKSEIDYKSIVDNSHIQSFVTDSLDVPDVVNFPDVSDSTDSTDSTDSDDSDVTDIPDDSDVPDYSDVADAIDVTDAINVTDAPDAPDVLAVPDVLDDSDIPKVPEVSIFDVHQELAQDVHRAALRQEQVLFYHQVAFYLHNTPPITEEGPKERTVKFYCPSSVYDSSSAFSTSTSSTIKSTEEIFVSEEKEAENSTIKQEISQDEMIRKRQIFKELFEIDPSSAWRYMESGCVDIQIQKPQKQFNNLSDNLLYKLRKLD